MVLSKTLWEKTFEVAPLLNFLGWTPLHEACNYGNLRIVQELVWSGANVNSLGYKAITPLHDAVINDHAKVGVIQSSRVSVFSVSSSTL